MVVGVSPRTGSPLALRWAVDEAALRGAEVRAVMGWQPSRAPATAATRPPAVPSRIPDDPQAGADARLASLTAAAVGNPAAVVPQVVRGRVVEALANAAADAELLVVQAPRLTGPGSTPVRAAAPKLLSHFRCPVVVIPPPAPDGPSPMRRATRKVAGAALRAAAGAGRPGVARGPSAG